MTGKPVFYSIGAAATKLGVHRVLLNQRVSDGQQAPDALLAATSKNRPDQPVWTAETLEHWGEVDPGEPTVYYTTNAAIKYLGIPAPTFNMHRRTKQDIPADAHVLRSATGEPQPVWTAASLDQWHKEVRAMVSEPRKPRGLSVYAPADAAALMNITRSAFERMLREHPMLADLVTLDSEPELAWTGKHLDAWTNDAEVSIKRRKPKAMTYYSEDEAPKLLGVTRAEFAKLMRSHPLPPEALVVSPAAHAWTKDTLEEWHAAATGQEGAK